MAHDAIESPSAPLKGLDYGTCGECRCENEYEISERGMKFISRWQFTIGTALAVCIRDMHPRLGMCHLQLEGTVVWCEPRDGKGYETTLLFLELPEEIRPTLREFSHQRPAPAR